MVPGNCLCTKYPGPDPPTYVGNYYYCESGNKEKAVNGLHINHPQWDGDGCPPEDGCCYVAGLPLCSWIAMILPSVSYNHNWRH